MEGLFFKDFSDLQFALVRERFILFLANLKPDNIPLTEKFARIHLEKTHENSFPRVSVPPYKTLHRFIGRETLKIKFDEAAFLAAVLFENLYLTTYELAELVEDDKSPLPFKVLPQETNLQFLYSLKIGEFFFHQYHDDGSQFSLLLILRRSKKPFLDISNSRFYFRRGGVSAINKQLELAGHFAKSLRYNGILMVSKLNKLTLLMWDKNFDIILQSIKQTDIGYELTYDHSEQHYSPTSICNYHQLKVIKSISSSYLLFNTYFDTINIVNSNNLVSIDLEFLNAISEGNIDAALVLLASGANINSADENKRTAFHVASCQANASLLSILTPSRDDLATIQKRFVNLSANSKHIAEKQFVKWKAAIQPLNVLAQDNQGCLASALFATGARAAPDPDLELFKQIFQLELKAAKEQKIDIRSLLAPVDGQMFPGLDFLN